MIMLQNSFFGPLINLRLNLVKKINELNGEEVKLDDPYPRATDNIEEIILFWIQRIIKNNPEQNIIDKFDSICGVLYKKNADYGCSVFQKPYLCDVSVDEAIRVRLSDKRNRYINLTTEISNAGQREVNYESIEDTMVDTIGYYILLWLWRQQQ